MDKISQLLLNVLKTEIVHFVAALFVSILFYIFTKSLGYSLLTFITAIFIDIDHLYDYTRFLESTKERPSLKSFLSGEYLNRGNNKFYAPLHSWELVSILVISYIPTGNLLFLALALGLTTHFIVDMITNDVNWKAYFLLYRVKNNFELKAILKNK